jgi:hypothetical protein
MSRIEIDEIVESLEGIVEYAGEQTYDPSVQVGTWASVWTCLRDLARCVMGTPQDFEGEEDTIDLIIQWALPPGAPLLGQTQLDAMRRLAKEILFLRATCRSAGLDMKNIERQTREMISRSEVVERRKA